MGIVFHFWDEPLLATTSGSTSGWGSWPSHGDRSSCSGGRLIVVYGQGGREEGEEEEELLEHF